MDFSTLTNDQLVTLVKAALDECAARGAAVAAAAQSAMLDASEKAQIAQEAARREAEKLKAAEAERIARQAAEDVRRQASQQARTAEQEKQNRQWGLQKTLAQMVIEVLGAGWNLNVWQKDTEKRVYLDRGTGRSATGRVEYYHTGNSSKPPKTLKCVEGVNKDARPLVQQIVEKACKDWNSMRMDCDQAAAAQVAAVGDVPAEFAAFGEARRAAEAEAERLAEEKRREAAVKDGTRPTIFAKAGVLCSTSYYNSTMAERPIAVTRDDDDPTRLDVVTVTVEPDGRFRLFNSLIGNSRSQRVPAAQWPDNIRAHFTPEEMALLASPESLPALTYAQIEAIVKEAAK